LPFQAGVCEGCGYSDYLEHVHGENRDAWLCRHCRETLEEDGELKLCDDTTIILNLTEYCGDCGAKLNPNNMWSEHTCKRCAAQLGLEPETETPP